jgi:conjugative transfer signal peptidase TraF
MKARPLLGIAVALALLVAPFVGKTRPLLIWNASASVPTGLYSVVWTLPSTGDLAVVGLPTHMAALAANREYLPRTAYLLKPVAAISGHRVCRFGGHVFIRGRFRARALSLDSRWRPLPRWQGCRMLQAGEFFLLSHEPESFDSRYVGPIQAEYIVGRATLIFRGW